MSHSTYLSHQKMGRPPTDSLYSTDKQLSLRNLGPTQSILFWPIQKDKSRFTFANLLCHTTFSQIENDMQKEISVSAGGQRCSRYKLLSNSEFNNFRSKHYFKGNYYPRSVIFKLIILLIKVESLISPIHRVGSRIFFNETSQSSDRYSAQAFVLTSEKNN